MAYRKKRNIDQTTSIPLSKLARGPEVSSYINRKIEASQYDFYETENMEVTSITLNSPISRGIVNGTLLGSGKNVTDVKPMFPNLTAAPVKGEQVNVVEYDGQHYYMSILNIKGSLNENSIPGASGEYIENTKYGNKFKRTKVKPIQIGEGCVLFEGRFGQTLHFDGHDNTPKIKISTHVDTSNGDYRSESIDEDDASIYLLSRGMSDMFDKQEVKGKKVLIKSNGIFISGDDVRLGSSVTTDIEPVVKGTTLKELLDPIFEAQVTQNETTMVENTAKIAQLAAIQPQTPQTIEEIQRLGESNINLAEMNVRLQIAIKDSTYLSETVKTV